MKPKWNVQWVAALLAVGTVSVLLTAVDFLARYGVDPRDALVQRLAPAAAPVLAGHSAGQPG